MGFFGREGIGDGFTLFGPAHLLSLAVVAVLMSRAFSGQGIDGFLRCHEGLLVFLTDLSGGLVGEC